MPKRQIVIDTNILLAGLRSRQDYAFRLLQFHCAIANRPQIFFLWRPFVRDPKDDTVLELALKAGCDYIVTYNKRDFAGVEKAFQMRVVDAGEFLRAIGA